MFRQVTNIRNFGVFGNFNGDTLPSFASFNLIYGWNYAGKTTLSRMFRCLEKGARHPDYPTAEFALARDGGINHDHTFATPCNIRVFNEDFRKEHLLWDDVDGFNPIVLLGAENIDRVDELRAKEKAALEIDARYAAASLEAKRLNEVLAKAETDCATQIVNELQVGRFNKTNLRPIFEAWDGTLPASLTVEQFKAERVKITAEQKDPLPNLSANVGPIEEIWSEGIQLLKMQVGLTTILPRFIDHPEIGSWVEHGRHLHKGKTRCEFCEGPLTSERIAALDSHFSDAFDELKRRIERAIETLSNRRLQFSSDAYPRSAFYVDLQAEHAASGKELGDAQDDYNAALNNLIEALIFKLANPFKVVEPPDIAPNLTSFRRAVARFQSVINSNNSRTDHFASVRSGAIETLKKHYAAEAMRKVDRYGILEMMDIQERLIETEAKNATTLSEEITELRAKLSDATKGAEAINDTLRRFFGKSDLQVKVTADDRFLLVRGTEPARNLSEGERTAIAFCYFVAKLLENGNDLSQTVVYIDDPISSLDSHHLLHINAFIKSTFYKFDSTATPKHSCLAKQLFISTHNYEFFHLTWDWMSGTPKGSSSAYLVERTDANGLISSRLIACPESIRRYRSEYLFLYHQLAGYLDSPSNDPQIIFNLGNMARRFVEGYLAFKFFEHSKIDLTLPRLISDPVDCDRARKFMHFYSHTLNRAGGMRLPDMSEAQHVLGIILEAVRSQDPIHYGALEATR